MSRENHADEVRVVAEALLAQVRASSGLVDDSPHALAELEMLAGVAAGVPATGGRKTGALARKVRGTVYRLTRWYVEPFVLQQRSFNLALVRYIADLERRIAELESERPAEPR